MKEVTQKALDIIKYYEGFEPEAYICPGGHLTIGYGHKILKNEKFRKITRAEAEKLLMIDSQQAAKQVNEIVTVDLTPNQLGALVSFTYNLGIGRLKTSTLLTKLNAKDFDGAAKEFDRWVYSGDKKLPGLVKRRKAEKELFLS